MQPAIRVENLCKVYRVNKAAADRDLRETLVSMASAPFRRLRHGATHSLDTDEYQALHDVSFEVPEGEILGIIGRNGAGKSTLLKILSRITEPTSGRIEMRGRVGSLLEVGTGFHPDLSGRENMYLNGAILGMRRREIDRKFDEIVDFAGVEQFIDTPVKRYSSGMRVRLGFAVAAHLEPEILIVDEVLAVGDAEFQKRCLGKMKDVAGSGRTVLFVSHNMQAVSTLTDRCLLLVNGNCIQDGEPGEVIQTYLHNAGRKDQAYISHPKMDNPGLTRISVNTSDPHGIQRHGAPLEITFELSTPEPLNGASLSFQITDDYGRPVLHLWTFDSERSWCREAGQFCAVCTIPRCRLYLGNYQLTVHFSEKPGGRRFERIEGICPFEVVMHSIYREFRWEPGTSVYLDDCEWSVSGTSHIAMAASER